MTLQPYGSFSLAPVKSEAIRRIAEAAIAEGNAVENAEWWSKAFVVWMTKPLEADFKARVLREFSSVRFAENPGGPHAAGSRSFVDGQFAIAFPWTPPPVR
jgi:hypothetical protein